MSIHIREHLQDGSLPVFTMDQVEAVSVLNGHQRVIIVPAGFQFAGGRVGIHVRRGGRFTSIEMMRVGPFGTICGVVDIEGCYLPSEVPEFVQKWPDYEKAWLMCATKRNQQVVVVTHPQWVQPYPVPGKPGIWEMTREMCETTEVEDVE